MNRGGALPLVVVMVAGCRLGGAPDPHRVLAEQLQDAARRVAEVRGGDPVVPAIERASADAIVQLFRDERDEHPEAQEELVRWGCVATALGLADDPGALEPAIDGSMGRFLGAIYHPESDRILVSADAPLEDDARFEHVLVHEAVHAWQFARVFSDRRSGMHRSAGDSAYVDRLLFEGDAELTTLHVLKGPAVLDALPDRWGRVRRHRGDDLLERYVRDTMALVYPQGLTAAHAVHRRGGQAAIDALLQRPAVSSEQLLDPTRADDPPRYVALDVGPAVGLSWTVHDATTAGRYGLERLLQATLRTSETDDALEGWDGDRLQCLEGPDGAALVARTVWDSPLDARQFERFLLGWPPRLAELTIETRGDEVLVLTGIPDDLREGVEAAAWTGTWEEVGSREALTPWLP